MLGRVNCGFGWFCGSALGVDIEFRSWVLCCRIWWFVAFDGLGWGGVGVGWAILCRLGSYSLELLVGWPCCNTSGACVVVLL